MALYLCPQGESQLTSASLRGLPQPASGLGLDLFQTTAPVLELRMYEIFVCAI